MEEVVGGHGLLGRGGCEVVCVEMDVWCVRAVGGMGGLCVYKAEMGVGMGCVWGG